MKHRYQIPCRPCIFCGRVSIVEIEATPEQIYDFDSGNRNIQDIFPELPVGTREVLITGTHPECWEKAGLDEEF